MKNILFIFTLVLFFSSCSKENDNPIIDGEINLSEITEGQKSTFLRYQSSCVDVNGDFDYTGDTLIVEVIQQNGELFFKEYVTPTSPLFLDGTLTSDVIYPAKNGGQGVIIPERWNSALFYFYANDTLRLGMNSTVDLIQDGCKLMLDEDPFIGNDIGELKSFQIGPIVYSDLTAVSCEPLEYLDAYLLHSDNQLFASHAIIFDFFNGGEEMVSGWKLLE